MFFEERVGVCSASDDTITITTNTRHSCSAAASHVSRANELNTDASVKLYDVYDSVPWQSTWAASSAPAPTCSVARHVLRVTCHTSRFTAHLQCRLRLLLARDLGDDDESSGVKHLLLQRQMQHETGCDVRGDGAVQRWR